MAIIVSNLSIKELKRLYLGQQKLPSSQMLSQLEDDSRQGVRQIYKTLLKRIGRDHLEDLRLNKLLDYERQLHHRGIRHVAGVDEAGMGPLAGPVVAAAIICPLEVSIPGVNDSKRLNALQRESIAVTIHETAISIGIGIADVDEIDRLNIYHAGLLAMRRAVAALTVTPGHILVDARIIPDITIPQTAFKKGDANHYSIAAASILAKTHRDQIMRELDSQYPVYGFSRRKGYGTEQHYAAIRELGPCPAHRKSFSVFQRSSDK